MTGIIARRLSELGLTLGPPVEPGGLYVPFVREGGLVQLAGVASADQASNAVVGKLGRDLNLEDGRRAARVCALGLLSNLRAACGGNLDRVRRFMMVRGFVNAHVDFADVPLVIDGASDLFIEVFGPEIGVHARTAIGCATLPNRAAVEIDALVIIDAEDL